MPEISDPIPEVGCGQSPQKAIIMMPYLSCKKIENDVYNFPTWQYCKYKDIFDSRIIINSTAKFYISISYQKDLLSIDTRIFTPSAEKVRVYKRLIEKGFSEKEAREIAELPETLNV